MFLYIVFECALRGRPVQRTVLVWYAIVHLWVGRTSMSLLCANDQWAILKWVITAARALTHTKRTKNWEKKIERKAARTCLLAAHGAHYGYVAVHIRHGTNPIISSSEMFSFTFRCCAHSVFWFLYCGLIASVRRAINEVEAVPEQRHQIQVDYNCLNGARDSRRFRVFDENEKYICVMKRSSLACDLFGRCCRERERGGKGRRVSEWRKMYVQILSNFLAVGIHILFSLNESCRNTNPPPPRPPTRNQYLYEIHE